MQNLVSEIVLLLLNDRKNIHMLMVIYFINPPTHTINFTYILIYSDTK